MKLTGDDCRVVKCASRGPSAIFLQIDGNDAVLDSCVLFALPEGAVTIYGDDALVQKLKVRQCEGNVIDIRGNDATVTMCTFVNNDDSYGIDIRGDDARVSKNQFTYCYEPLFVGATTR